jgi:alpha-D-xyloside xylohydrolase
MRVTTGKKTLIYCLLLLIYPGGYSFGQFKGSIKKTKDKLEITYQGLPSSIDQQISVSPITDKILHIVSTPLRSNVAQTKNLIIPENLKKEDVDWAVEEKQDFVHLRTASLEAVISLSTGAITFNKPDGTPLLSESPRNQGTFIPDAHDGDSFFKVKQQFLVTETEGLYGLGQHQNGVMNYNNGRQVKLLQYNTMIGVPFLLSTRNYGLLWHNYSITTAGDTRQKLPLSAFRLYSREGHRGWLTATYHHKNEPDKEVLSRPESEISYLYLTDQHKFPKDIDLANSLIRYEGHMESPYTGLHRLHFRYSGYVKVWINGELKEDRWREAWNAGSFEIDWDITAGQRYPIKIEWLPDGGESYLGIDWQSPLPDQLKNTFAFDSEAGDAVNYYFIAGNNADQVISGYRYLTGKAPIVPKWALGFWQSRERYKTQEELENTATEFRRRKIPIDNIVQDWSYWPEHDWGSHNFDKSRFPDFGKAMEKLHGDNFRLMISVWPKVNEEAEVYQEMRDKGWLYLRNIYDGRKDWIGRGYTSTFYDPFNVAARKGFWKLMNDKLYQKGVDAWWMDASEPDMHSNINMEERKAVMQPAIGSSTRYYNAFPLENARGIYEGQRETDPDKRVFILTRSFFAGQQRYAAVAWSGDISSRWHDFKDQISAGVNFSLSGTPYWTMDAGGFLVEKRFHKPNDKDLEEWRELNARWYQYGSFLPVFRAHGQFPFREPFNIAPDTHPAYNSMLYYIKLRYKLLPYHYSLAARTYFDDYSIIRGLAMDFPDDGKSYNINDQYLYGPSILVNPVTEKGATSRVLYLPSGSDWYDFYTGQAFTGGQSLTASAPYERIPLYVKSGTILPIGPDLQYTNEKPTEELTLFIYAGANGDFKLYEDDDTSYNYEKGEYTSTLFHYNNDTATLEISTPENGYPQALKKRTFRLVYVQKNKPAGFESTNHVTKTVRYTGKPLSVRLK